MEELAQLQAGFVHEQDVFTEAVASRKVVLDGYIDSLTTVQKKIGDIIASHKNDVLRLLDEKESIQKDTLQIQETHAAQFGLLTKSCSDKTSELVDKQAKLDDLISRESQINKSIDTLVAEHRDTESRMGTLRVNLSILERKNADAVIREKALIDSIAKKTDEDVKLSNDLESKKQQATRLSNDVAILEARKNK